MARVAQTDCCGLETLMHGMTIVFIVFMDQLFEQNQTDGLRLCFDYSTNHIRCTKNFFITHLTKVAVAQVYIATISI